MTRKKGGGGSELQSGAYKGITRKRVNSIGEMIEWAHAAHICVDWENGVVCDCDRIHALEAQVAKQEDRTQVLLHCDIAELKARIALMEQATCDFCGHAFYALEADG